jgi:hypothetical protein
MYICAYYGNRWVHHFERDLEEIQEKGFDTILHTVSEDDLEFAQGALEKIFQMTRDAGMTLMVDPWGVGNLFGYGTASRLIAQYPRTVMLKEDFTTKPYLCPLSSPLKEYMIDEWIPFVYNNGAQWILWDEPQLAQCYCYECEGKSPLLEALVDYSLHARICGIKNSLCLYGDIFTLDHISLSRLYNLAYNMDDVGCTTAIHRDDFVLHEAEERATFLSHFVKMLTPQTTSLWIQAYDIPDGEEDSYTDMVNVALNLGIDNIGYWGFRGNENFTGFSSDQSAILWEKANRRA